MPLAEYLAFAHDPDGSAGIEDRDDLAWFALEDESQGGAYLGYSTDAIWGRVVVQNLSTQALHVLVELPVARMKELSWYVLDGDRVEVEVKAGMGSPGRRAAPRTRFPLVCFVVPGGAARTVYMRARSDTSMMFPLTLAKESYYLGYAARRDFLDHAFLGIGMAIMLLSLLNAWVQRDQLFLLLSVVVAGFLGYYSIFQGYYAWLGGPLQGWVNRQFMLALAMVGNGAFFLFTLVYVRDDTRARSPFAWAERVPRLLWAGALLVGVLPFRASVPVFSVLLCLCYGAGLVVVVRAVGGGSRHGRLLAVVWGFVLLIVLLMYSGLFAWFAVPWNIMLLQRTIMMAIFLVFFAIVTLRQRSVRHEADRARRAEQMATEARLHALRYQLNPHFLFNTLTAVEALSRKDPGRIAPLVRKLAVYLRLRMQPAPDAMTLFGQEWESIRAYLDIEQVRFGHALHVQYDVSEEVLPCRLPEMLVQPLVENAVKHGMAQQQADRLQVLVRVRRRGLKLHIRVENTGHLEGGTPPDAGVGLCNVKERLRHLYGDAAHMTLREEAGRVVAEIVMPCEESVL